HYSGEETVKIIGLVQAHYLGWAGAQDLSLARVGGKYAVEAVIDRLQAMPQIGAVTIAVPDDQGNEIFREIAAARGDSCVLVLWVPPAPMSCPVPCVAANMTWSRSPTCSKPCRKSAPSLSPCRTIRAMKFFARSPQRGAPVVFSARGRMCWRA